MPIEIIAVPKPREVVVICIDWAKHHVAFAYGARCRTTRARALQLGGDEIAGDLISGESRDELGMSDIAFKNIMDSADAGWRVLHPGARIVYEECPPGMMPLDFVKRRAAELVSV